MTTLRLIVYAEDHDFDNDGHPDLVGPYLNPSGLVYVTDNNELWTARDGRLAIHPGSYTHLPGSRTFLGYGTVSDGVWYLLEAKNAFAVSTLDNKHACVDYLSLFLQPQGLEVTQDGKHVFLWGYGGVSVWRTGVVHPLRFNSRNDTLGVTAKHPRIQGKSASTTSASSQTGIRLKEHPSSYH